MKDSELSKRIAIKLKYTIYFEQCRSDWYENIRGIWTETSKEAAYRHIAKHCAKKYPAAIRWVS